VKQTGTGDGASQAQAVPFGGGVDPDHAGVVQVEQVGQHLVGVEAFVVDPPSVGFQRSLQGSVLPRTSSLAELIAAYAGTAAVTNVGEKPGRAITGESVGDEKHSRSGRRLPVAGQPGENGAGVGGEHRLGRREGRSGSMTRFRTVRGQGVVGQQTVLVQPLGQLGEFVGCVGEPAGWAERDTQPKVRLRIRVAELPPVPRSLSIMV